MKKEIGSNNYEPPLYWQQQQQQQKQQSKHLKAITITQIQHNCCPFCPFQLTIKWLEDGRRQAQILHNETHDLLGVGVCVCMYVVVFAWTFSVFMGNKCQCAHQSVTRKTTCNNHIKIYKKNYNNNKTINLATTTNLQY